MTTTTVMPAPAARLVRRYYMYGGLYTLAASIIWGVNTLFLLDAGLSISEVFIANAAWAAGTMIFEIPTGVVADTVGRRISFLLSLVVLAITTLVYVGLAQVGGGLVAFAVVSVLIGLGFTFYSGAMEAWLVDGLRFHGYDGELDRVFSRGQMVSGAAMLRLGALEQRFQVRFEIDRIFTRSLLVDTHRAVLPCSVIRFPEPIHVNVVSESGERHLRRPLCQLHYPCQFC